MSKKVPSVPMTPVDPGVTLELSVRDRLIFGSVFPEQSNLLEMRIVKQIERKIELGVAELVSIGYQDVVDQEGRPTGKVKWDGRKEKILKVYLSGIEIDFLKKAVNRLSAEGKIKQEFAELAIKIEDSKKGA